MTAEIELIDGAEGEPERLRLSLGGQTYDLGIGFGTGASLRDLLALASGRKPLDERANQIWRTGDGTGRAERGATEAGLDPLEGIEITKLKPRGKARGPGITITVADLSDLGL